MEKKVKDLHQVHVRYNALVKSHSVLKQKHSVLKKKYLKLEHHHQRLQNQAELARITEGVDHGRHVASYSLEERFKVAMQHIRNKKFHDAYVLFESVLNSPEGAVFQNASVFYQAGVSAYQIRNWKRAKQLFEAASAHAHSFKDFEVIQRADLWLKVLNRTEVNTIRESK